MTLRLVTPRYLLLDFDGTLVDSERLHYTAFHETLAIYESQLLQNFDYHQFKGAPSRSVFSELGVGSVERVEALTADKQRRYREAIVSGRLLPLPGAKSLLSWGRQNGLRNYVVTGGSQCSVAEGLLMTGLNVLIDGMITADDVGRGKPTPDCYLACLERFSLEAGDCLAVEDAVAGIRACRSAGVSVAGVWDHEIANDCDWWFPSLAALEAELARSLTRDVWP